MKKVLQYFLALIYASLASLAIGVYLLFILKLYGTYIMPIEVDSRIMETLLFLATTLCCWILIIPAMFLHIPITKYTHHIHWSVYIIPAIIVLYFGICAIIAPWLWTGSKYITLILGLNISVILAYGYNINKIVESYKND